MSYQPVTYSLSGLMPGVHGTVQTLQEMARLVRRDSKKLDIVSLARSIVKDVTPHDELGEINAIHEYVKNNLRYVQDPVDVEWVQDAERSLLLGAGDCDDGTDLFATLVAAMGYVPVYALAGYDPDPNSQYDHVWVSVRTNDNKWTDADFSEYKPLGWHGSGFAKLAYFPIFEGTPMPTMGRLGQDDGSGDFTFDDSFFTDESGGGGLDTSGLDSFDWSSIFGDMSDPTLDPNYDPNATLSAGDWESLLNDPNYFDPTNPVSSADEDIALFNDLQKNFGYTGTKIDDFSLQDIGIYTSGDGSYVTVNPDGTLSFTNSNGSMVGQLVDSSGNVLNAQTMQPSAIKQVAQTAAKALAPSSGGGGGGIPLGGGGGQKLPTPTQPTSTADSLSKTIASIANSIKSVLTGTPLSPYGSVNRINPLTGKPIATNGLYTSPQGAGIQLNTTTIIIGVLLFMALKK